MATRYEQRCVRKIILLESQMFQKCLDSLHGCLLVKGNRYMVLWDKIVVIRNEYLEKLANRTM
jgi:hypothetical protein